MAEHTNFKQENRLINEKSPYLLQHAHNPVDWYPWSPIAFEKARREDKPVFLSIGYSTCHWCHVMERESFEDETVARILNESFVSIKVDREERPDIDHIYMDVCQALTGHGGWPLTIIMTPDQKPFFAGTYFPKNDRLGMQGIITILERTRDAWQTKREALLSSSRIIMNHISREKGPTGKAISDDVFDIAFTYFKQHFDPFYGGFGTAPKFPTPHNLMFLLRYWKKTNEPQALNIVEKTLDSMYRGGIYDHIGFGFCRYSTDKKWLVPHFEKMLYDNALLAMTYLEAYQITRKDQYGLIAKDILTYVLRDMTSNDSGFYSAEDADSEGVEGKFYLWNPEEIREVLGDEDARSFCMFYDITSKGNFEGKSIPNLINNKMPYESIDTVKKLRDRLFEHREGRIHPYKDDKILTSWNGLMIAAMAVGGRVLQHEPFIDAARKASDFILTNLKKDNGRLLARYRDGEANFPAYADDYAFLTWGLIELYQSTFESYYLKKAIEITDQLLSLFWDDKNGGLFVYGIDGEVLITRPKDIYDGATPSGNSVSALNLLRLSRLTGRTEYEDKAHQIIKAFSGNIRSYPIGHSFALMALLFVRSKTQEVVIVSDNRQNAIPLIETLQNGFRPFTVSLLYQPGDKVIKDVAPFVESYGSEGDKALAYVCENFSCKAPVDEVSAFNSLLS